MSRRIDMEALKNIPKDELIHAVVGGVEELENVWNMNEVEMKEEILDLRAEKRLLIAAVEYLKERLTK